LTFDQINGARYQTSRILSQVKFNVPCSGTGYTCKYWEAACLVIGLSGSPLANCFLMAISAAYEDLDYRRRQGRKFRQSIDNPAAAGSGPSHRLKDKRLPFGNFDRGVSRRNQFGVRVRQELLSLPNKGAKRAHPRPKTGEQKYTQEPSLHSIARIALRRFVFWLTINAPMADQGSGSICWSEAGN
jgi:hypothetical protein